MRIWIGLLALTELLYFRASDFVVLLEIDVNCGLLPSVSDETLHSSYVRSQIALFFFGRYTFACLGWSSGCFTFLLLFVGTLLLSFL